MLPSIVISEISKKTGKSLQRLDLMNRAWSLLAIPGFSANSSKLTLNVGTPVHSSTMTKAPHTRLSPHHLRSYWDYLELSDSLCLFVCFWHTSKYPLTLGHCAVRIRIQGHNRQQTKPGSTGPKVHLKDPSVTVSPLMSPSSMSLHPTPSLLSLNSRNFLDPKTSGTWWKRVHIFSGRVSRSVFHFVMKISMALFCFLLPNPDGSGSPCLVTLFGFFFFNW